MVGILIVFAIFDLIVGVSNDAVNFLNSSIASKVASRKVILIVASLGIIVGVLFSGGMMEVARKGIFHPQYFTMPELMSIFLAVMITDILLLDLFNTYGFPTSTTVSIVFELLGAAVAASIFNILNNSGSLYNVWDYINTSKAMTIIFSILLSVVVAFSFGVIAQFLTRIIFTYDYKKRLVRYGAIWCGVALTSITFFILIKGAKGASFFSLETVLWIKSHSLLILSVMFIISTIIAQILIFLKVNILKYIILIGTFALALSFAANDLVNFIGVPLAGLLSYNTAVLSDAPLTTTMSALAGSTPINSFFLLIAGIVMVITLWVAKKTRTVSETEIGLSQQGEKIEKYGSIAASRFIVRMTSHFFQVFRNIVPQGIQTFVDYRVNPERFSSPVTQGDIASYDLIRASVNLMVASGVISFATSLKLPLSTTYVTFMVAMGTSFADGAWGRDSAVYRVTGVLTVIGGWFITAFMAFTAAFIFCSIMSYFSVYSVIFLLIIVSVIIWINHKTHQEKLKDKEEDEIFNLKKIEDPNKSILITYDHLAKLLQEIANSLNLALEALFAHDIYLLRKEKRRVKRIQLWSNIIIANIFKVLRLLQKGDTPKTFKYVQIIRRLQKLTDGYRDIVLRSYTHVNNHHKGLLPIQIEELKEVKDTILPLLDDVANIFSSKEIINYDAISDKYKHLWEIADKINEKQLIRIKDGTSKTRLTILFYSISSTSLMIAKQNLKLLQIFKESFFEGK